MQTSELPPIFGAYNVEMAGEYGAALDRARRDGMEVVRGDYPHLWIVRPSDVPAFELAGYERA